jgi:putative ABC transport system permease protein
MVGLLWLRGLLQHRRARVFGAVVGIAIAVSLVASIGAFLSGSTAAMTQRAIAGVPLDWQIQTRQGTQPGSLLPTVRAYPPIRAALPVAFFRTSGATATAGGATNSASSGLVIGIPADYRNRFPGELRQYVGARQGVLIAQQMAANLGVGVGGTVAIPRPGMSAVRLKVDGLIDFTAGPQLLTPVGVASTTAAPPPDNVMVIPLSRWHAAFDRVARAHPDLVRYQIHAELDHRHLPHDPTGAYSAATGLARNLEVRLQGRGIVGNNLAAALDHARGDSLYAQLAFLFLGLPGALLAMLLTITLASAGSDRRRREQALLRARGATIASLVRIALAETLFVGVLGGLVGLAAALVIGRTSFGSASFGAGSRSAALWALASLAGGLVVAAAAIALPAWRDARRLTVHAARSAVGRPRAPWWARFGLDALAFAGSIAIFWATGSNNYQLVLAAEGVSQVSVNYWSFLAPLLAWIGIGLFSFRLADLLLRRGRFLVSGLARPTAGDLAGTVAASMSRQRGLIARSVALVALATTFAVSTAAFNTTYQQQALADARLSNGADVVVTTARSAHLPPSFTTTLARIPGVGSVEPLQHRYAYIGKDLQDLFGVNPRTVASHTQLQDAWFTGGSAKTLLARLARTPNGVLLSAEVVHDYQLQPGDTLVMRLLDRKTNAPISAKFRYIGITNEFPTAPKDAYTIVNASYVTKVTGDPGIGAFLIQTPSASPAAVAKRVAAAVGTAGTVTDIDTNRTLIAGSLTSVELSGLTRVELAYALVLVAAATGLLLWLGIAERRRMFAIASALGARPRQLGGFIWTETAFVTIGGVVLGAAGSSWLSWMLVKLLTGVFDPPPTAPAVPWAYLVLLAVVTVAAVATAGASALRGLRRPALETLRDL